MDPKEWISFFGRANDDKKVEEALGKVGVKNVPVIKKDRLDTRVELADSMLIFSTPELFPSREAGGDGTSLLTGLVLPLKGIKWGEYKGSLPFQLERSDSQKKLRARFGEPIESDEDFYWDEWKVDGLLLRVTYTEDLGSLSALSVKLPNEV